MKILQSLLFLAMSLPIMAQTEVPDVHACIRSKRNGKLYFLREGKKIKQAPAFVERIVFGPSGYSVENFSGNPSGTATGIQLDFNNRKLKGEIIYGLIPYGDSDHPMPVFRQRADVKRGRVFIELLNSFSGVYDMTGWQDSGYGMMGYRLINNDGQIFYDGRVGFKGKGPFTIDDYVIEGPFITNTRPDGATLFFTTNRDVICTVEIDGRKVSDEKEVRRHEIVLKDLEVDMKYTYKLLCGSLVQEYSFRTAPEPGTRKPFIFAYASDSRQGNGGGERELFGANAYIMKKIMALSIQKQARFLQFTGDLINGYLPDIERTNLQYANWKRSIEPFAHYLPVYSGMGNHEIIMNVFVKLTTRKPFLIDKFPFHTQSAEYIFKENFVHPENGPDSEDGEWYDPDPSKTDFPSYSENVYYFIYDNVAMIVLNSDYWYSPTIDQETGTDGNLHGYIMDKQLAWLEETLSLLEADDNIDHIFVTQHTPAFPNGGHSGDDMWYHGNNEPRAYVAGQAVKQGIIERRDEYLDLLVNKSSKVVAMLTGDEHNYNRLHISEEMKRYPSDYSHEKLVLSRDILQINNGAAGAPYYAQEVLPWSEYVSGFTTQHALVLIKVDGNRVEMEVLNPDTLEKIDSVIIKE